MRNQLWFQKLIECIDYCAAFVLACQIYYAETRNKLRDVKLCYFNLFGFLTLFLIFSKGFEICSRFKVDRVQCMKSVGIRSYSGPYFPAFILNTEIYSVSLHIQSECGKIGTRITPNTDTFYAVVL